MIRDAQERDCEAIAGIYNYYVDNTVVSFEETGIDDSEVASRIAKVTSAGLCWLVLEEGGRVVGYASASNWHQRVAYRHTVEVSVYLDHRSTGRGHGSRLYAELFRRLESTSVHAVISLIALPNPGSVRLHEKFGMRQVGHLKEVGYKFGQWIDVGFWQLHLGA